ncbi:MAG: hypothetical protein ACP5N0_02560 [Methanosarcina sp.]|jgi:hypothetical protein|uniref:hypothetical protein n=1 Tax=Methanosarcina sp. TaxID=2213 RepID=UPI003BB7BAE0
MVKKLIPCLVLLLILVAALPFSAEAADEETFIRYTSSGNAFGGGDNLQIDQDIQGDLVLAGSLLEINGNIGDDFIGAGGEIIVNGNVSGNIIAAGGSIKVNGNVGGDVAAVGGQVLLSRDSVVEGDILIGGGEVTLNGIVNGNGEVSTSTLRTGNDFQLKGNLKLEAENYPSNLKDNVGKNLNITKRTGTADQNNDISEGFGIFSFIIGLLASIALGFILIYIYPDFISELAKIVKGSTFKAGILGFLILVFLPILAIILLITLFGWSLSVLIILFLTLAILIATVPVKLLAGEIIYYRVFKKEAGKMVYYLLGAVIFALAYEIPLVGGFIRFIALLIGLGVIVIWLTERARPTS